jgi:hypothetical protein
MAALGARSMPRTVLALDRAMSWLTLRERCGLWVGALLAPITGALSRAREARMFHPDGIVYEASVEPIAQSPDAERLAERLGERAIVRLSSALWRTPHEWPDVLGAALRFGEGAAQQDLLLATIRFPWTMPFAPLATRFHSFLWNHYHAVSPFAVDGVGSVKFRLRSPRASNSGSMSRAEHLRRAVAEQRAVYELELRRMSEPLMTRHWEPVARITLQKPLDVDQRGLCFSPFRDGAGIRPIGFVHALRVAAYGASQQARPHGA